MKKNLWRVHSISYRPKKLWQFGLPTDGGSSETFWCLEPEGGVTCLEWERNSNVCWTVNRLNQLQTLFTLSGYPRCQSQTAIKRIHPLLFLTKTPSGVDQIKGCGEFSVVETMSTSRPLATHRRCRATSRSTGPPARRANRVLAQRSQAVATVGAWVEEGPECLQEHPFVSV